MSVGVEKQAILMSLEPLYKEAAEKGLWFFHESGEVGEVWCSPEYLRLRQSKDELVWAPEHWELRSPAGYLKRLRAQIESSIAEYNDLARRLGQDKALTLEETAATKGEG